MHVYVSNMYFWISPLLEPIAKPRASLAYSKGLTINLLLCQNSGRISGCDGGSLTYYQAWFTRQCWCHNRHECHRKIPDIKIFDNLIGWKLANTGDAMLEQKSSLFQCHSNAHDITLARASYCEPGFMPNR